MDNTSASRANIPVATSFSAATRLKSNAFSGKMAGRFFRDTSLDKATRMNELEKKRKEKELKRERENNKKLQADVCEFQ